MKIIAQAISWIFLPLFMPVYGLLLTMYVPSQQDYFFNYDCVYAMYPPAKAVILATYILFCVLAPGISIIIMRRSGFITTIEMEKKEERNIPILVMLTYCLILYFWIFIKVGDSSMVPKFILSLPISGVFVTLAFFFLNKWRKLSIHAAAAGIVVGYILAYILYQTQFELWMLTASILVSGIIMSARVYLKKHTVTEVLLGWVVGCLLTFGVNYLY